MEVSPFPRARTVPEAMHPAYDPAEMEPRWQARWEQDGLHAAAPAGGARPKLYVLDMFPYPSGAGLHMGHVENYTISDVIARWARAKGYNVLHPMGWDAFGLPAEQYALQHGVHPRVAVERNVRTFREQIRRMGWSYDWSREIDTTDPAYYRWTQWIFARLYEKGLAYEAEVPVNWCEALGTVLANEEVIDGKSERGGHPVVRRPMRQWLLKITDYAQRLLDDLDLLDWPESLKQMQREWIGRSEGADIRFDVAGHSAASFEVFTTRPDTLFGATFCVLAPEHPLVGRITAPQCRAAVESYVAAASVRSERDRLVGGREKTGVFTGAYAVNPANGEAVPLWIADYVLPGYGSGAVMAVPGHDQRDWEFARAMGLEIREVVRGGDLAAAAYEGDGPHVQSQMLDGLHNDEAKRVMVAWLTEQGLGRARVTFRLRDWLFSRQRYWGEPFPILHRKDGRTVLVPDADLPVRLPEVEQYEPTGTGESPLATISEWVDARDPSDGAPARRETNTMPQWAGSCWYYLRFLDPHNDRDLVDRNVERAWMPVDIYVGGVEHAVLHLLYARFWHKVLHDLGRVSTREPFQRLVNQGMILAPAYRNAAGAYVPADEVRPQEDGFVHPPTGDVVQRTIEKMSKSKKNVVNPDPFVREYGADTLRLYILFLGPPEDDKFWDSEGIAGMRRFVLRIWRLFFGDDRHAARPLVDRPPSGPLRQLLHDTIARTSADMEARAFHTAISKLMVLHNALSDSALSDRALSDRALSDGEGVPRAAADAFLRMLAPFAPHLADECWTRLGFPGLATAAAWPTWDEYARRKATLDLAVQVDGKVRGRVEVDAGAAEAEVLARARSLENVARRLEGRTLQRAMVIPGRLVVFVTEGAAPS